MMLDDLADPAPPPGDRSAVLARGKKLRRRRQVRQGLILATGAALGIGALTTMLTLTITDGPTPGAGPLFSDLADGRPGWGTQSARCEPLLPVTSAGDLPDDLVGTLSTPAGTITAGTPTTVQLTLTNTGSADVVVRLPRPERAYAARAGQPVGLLTQAADPPVTTVVLPANGTASWSLPLVTTSCGDTSRDPAVPLPPGSYQASVELGIGPADGLEPRTATLLSPSFPLS